MAHKHGGHAKAYLAVWVSLLVLTVITVWVSYFNFGTFNILVAMLVATIKGALVCLYFMHLRYDNRVNQVVFVSAFFFLGIFVSLTASDELFRTVERAPTPVTEEEKPGGGEIKEFLKSTPELLAKGKEIYAIQCAVCHGVEGKGDGAGAAALNPKPRNFTSGEWRYGGGVARVFQTITEGSPGTSMASFGNLSVKERFALAHYVRTFSQNPQEDKPEDLKALGLDGAAPEAAAVLTEEPKRRLPLSFAMKRMAQDQVMLTDVAVVPHGEAAQNLGEKIYHQHCLSCHGLNGKGGIPVKQISVNPPVYLKTKILAGSTAVWFNNPQEFISIVSKGLPGRGKPGIAGFSDTEWAALHQYVRSLKP